MTPQRPSEAGPQAKGHQPGVIISPAGGFSWLEEDAGKSGPSSRCLARLGKKDRDVLQGLLRLNQDAASFFERAEKSARHKEAQNPLSELKKLHKIMADNISARVKETGAAADSEERHFGLLHEELAGGLDAAVVDHLVEAEDRCLARMETAMDDGLSMSAQVFLAAQLEGLGWAYKHMKALNAAVKKDTCQ